MNPMNAVNPMNRLLGQGQAVETLMAALASGRVQHAWIFAGPRGVGKFTAAVEFARILLDPDARVDGHARIEIDPGGRTSALIDAGSHPDLHIVRKELARYSDNPQLRERKLMNIPLDLLRERVLGGRTGDDRVHEAAAYRTPALNHGKVFIIDEAELLDDNAQNALLKTLEEPPPATYLFLITSRPERLLPTVRSRCQHVPFVSLDDAAMAAWFERSGLELTGAQRAWLECFAEGAPGLVVLAHEYGFDQWHSALDPMFAWLAGGQFPAAMGELLATFVEEFARTWVKKHENASKEAANRDGARHVLAILAAHARTRLRNALDAGDEPQPWLRVIDLFRSAEAALHSNVSPRFVFENLVAQWSSAMNDSALATHA